jgi:hypothetical protein
LNRWINYFKQFPLKRHKSIKLARFIKIIDWKAKGCFNNRANKYLYLINTFQNENWDGDKVNFWKNK